MMAPGSLVPVSVKEIDDLDAMMLDDGHNVPCWNKRETPLHETDKFA